MAMASNPSTSFFTAGEPQEEALARIDYLRERGGGWCEVVGPPRIGKSTLLEELSRRARRRGERCTPVEVGPSDAADWLRLVADAWNLAGTSSPLDVRRVLLEHIIGLAAMHRAVWIVVDQVEELSREMTLGIRWLTSLARRQSLTLMIVSAHRHEGGSARDAESDLRLDLWPWEQNDCRQFLADFCRARQLEQAFSPEAVAHLAEHSGGVPGELAKLAEWSWLAAQAEAEPAVEPDLVAAIAEEMTSPRYPRQRSYEVSAAYGAW
jgi:hypothetical protein